MELKFTQVKQYRIVYGAEMGDLFGLLQGSVLWNKIMDPLLAVNPSEVAKQNFSRLKKVEKRSKFKITYI